MRKTKIKKTSRKDYTIYLGEIRSRWGFIWKVYQKDVTPRIGAFMQFDWHIVRKNDGLVLSNNGLPEDVSLYHFNANKELIQRLIIEKEGNV